VYLKVFQLLGVGSLHELVLHQAAPIRNAGMRKLLLDTLHCAGLDGKIKELQG
jgi:hypothetical protein